MGQKRKPGGAVILSKVRRQGRDSTTPTSSCTGGMLGKQNMNGKLQKNKQENRELSRRENRKRKSELNKVN